MILTAINTTITFDDNGNVTLRDNSTTILRAAKKVRFYCRHCGAIFETTHHFKTRRGYSTGCPCCPYTAWGK